jgi:hypothetical protein
LLFLERRKESYGRDNAPAAREAFGFVEARPSCYACSRS